MASVSTQLRRAPADLRCVSPRGAAVASACGTWSSCRNIQYLQSGPPDANRPLFSASLGEGLDSALDGASQVAIIRGNRVAIGVVNDGVIRLSSSSGCV